jgi:hypothetical protein
MRCDDGGTVVPKQEPKTGGSLTSRPGRLSAVGSLPRSGVEAGELPKKRHAVQGHSRGVLERGRLEKVFAPGVIEPAVTEMLGGRAGDPRANGWGDFERMIQTWEAGLGDSPWILGDRFTAADVMLGATGVLFRRFKLFRDYPSLSGYIGRCEQREAFRRTLAVDNTGPWSLPARAQNVAMAFAASVPGVRKGAYWLLDHLRRREKGT